MNKSVFMKGSVFLEKARICLSGKWLGTVTIFWAASLPVALVNFALPLLLTDVFHMTTFSEKTGAMQMNLIASFITYAVSLCATAILWMGQHRYALLISKEEKVTFRTIYFFLGRHLLKALGLQLVVVLKVSAWIIPGMILIVFGTDSKQIVQILGAVLMAVLGGMALLRYALAPFRMADNPDIGIREAIRGSISAMEDKKGKMFWLDFRAVGWIRILVILFGVWIPVLRTSPYSTMVNWLVMPFFLYQLVSQAFFYRAVLRQNKGSNQPAKKQQAGF